MGESAPVSQPLTKNPQFRSAVKSVIVAGAGGVATWAVSKGFVPAESREAFLNYVIGGISAAIALGGGWLQARSQSERAMIKTINESDNGVKVVPEGAADAPVDQPLRGKI